MPRRTTSRRPLVLAGLSIAAVLVVAGAALALLTRGGDARTLPAIAPGPGVSAPSAEQTHSAATTRSLDAYRGLATWVDIYDAAAWRDPAAAVRDMAQHGVRALFIETGNSGQPAAIFNPGAQASFIREAHARGMYVVAWYLPEMTDPTRDLERAGSAIAFRTADGQAFDSFALDIESGKVHSVTARNSRLAALSAGIRALAGPAYPLGAIIPSPVGMSRKPGYWPHFPYAMLERTYDVLVPMSYYSYHGKGSAAAYADTMDNVRLIRSQGGMAAMPIHLIGGIAEESAAQDASGFVRAALDSRVIGAGLYGWVGTTPAHWRELAAIKP